MSAVLLAVLSWAQAAGGAHWGPQWVPPKPKPAAGAGASTGAPPIAPRSAPVKEPATAQLLELEASLAKGPEVYLFLDPVRAVLEVRSRGYTLDTVSLQSVEILHHAPLLGGARAALPQLPAVWKVEEGPGDSYREVIAPDLLRPYVPEDQRQEDKTAPQAKPIATPPAVYQIKMSSGWSLLILTETPRTGFFARYVQGVKDGWAKLRGREAKHPALVALAVAPDDAQRLYHLFRTNTPVLVAAGEG